MAANMGSCKTVTYRYTFFKAPRPNAGYNLLIHEVARTQRTTPLDEWSARRRELYKIRHNTHQKQTFMPTAGFEPSIIAADLRLKPRGNRDRLRSALRLSSATWCNRPYWARASSIVRLHDHTQRDAPHSAGLFWMNDPPSVETSTWQHTSLKRDKHSSPGGIRTRNPSKQAAADPSLRPRGVVIIIQLDLLFIYSNMYLFMRLLDSLVTNIPRKK